MCCRFAELIVKYEGKHDIFCVFHKSLLVTVCYEFLQRIGDPVRCVGIGRLISTITVMIMLY